MLLISISPKTAKAIAGIVLLFAAILYVILLACQLS